ncbi:MAG: LPS assembly lipoprotein LptE [Planctomycetes bacterium]|nr:LPS assembly lipoprotein LptE [Planctomycetota bacterium]
MGRRINKSTASERRNLGVGGGSGLDPLKGRATIFAGVLVSIITSLFAGSCGYNLGGGGLADVESVYVFPVENLEIPVRRGVEEILYESIGAELRRMPQLSASVGEAAADATLKVAITDVEESALVEESRDVPAYVRVRVVAIANYFGPRGEAIFRDREFVSESDVNVSASSREAALADAMRKLARQIATSAAMPFAPEE